MKTLVVLGVLLVSAGCGREQRAVLDDARGLAEDSPVYVQGVKVGTVQSVRLSDGHAEVAFEIDSEHELTLHADSCALATELRGTPVLIVLPGERGARDGGPLPQCTLPADQLAQALESFGGLARGMLEQMMRGFAGGAPPSFPMPAPMTPPSFAVPAPAPQGPAPAAGSLCDGLSFQVGNSQPISLPIFGQGHVVALQFTNGNAGHVEIAESTQAVFLGPGRRVLTRLEAPLPQLWFMPLTVPGSGSLATSIALSSGDGSAPVLESIEVDVGTGGLDRQRCTIHPR